MKLDSDVYSLKLDRIFNMLSSTDEIIASDYIYGQTYILFMEDVFFFSVSLIHHFQLFFLYGMGIFE